MLEVAQSFKYFFFENALYIIGFQKKKYLNKIFIPPHSLTGAIEYRGLNPLTPIRVGE